ncbi:hypothetical protein LY76DRAFT_195901 [Colletotrichum caudatum]|nr:hypothetical protein LY76DRAFT_195901 [Colletotrichum caudatum]
MVHTDTLLRCTYEPGRGYHPDTRPACVPGLNWAGSRMGLCGLRLTWAYANFNHARHSSARYHGSEAWRSPSGFPSSHVLDVRRCRRRRRRVVPSPPPSKQASAKSTNVLLASCSFPYPLPDEAYLCVCVCVCMSLLTGNPPPPYHGIEPPLRKAQEKKQLLCSALLCLCLLHVHSHPPPLHTPSTPVCQVSSRAPLCQQSVRVGVRLCKLHWYSLDDIWANAPVQPLHVLSGSTDYLFVFFPTSILI